MSSWVESMHAWTGRTKKRAGTGTGRNPRTRGTGTALLLPSDLCERLRIGVRGDDLRLILHHINDTRAGARARSKYGVLGGWESQRCFLVDGGVCLYRGLVGDLTCWRGLGLLSEGIH